MASVQRLREAPGTALYRRIANLLTEDIASGVLEPGHRLPSEQQLAEHYGVARMTARHALEQLAADGLISRRHGLGTFVANSKIVRRVTGMTGFFEDLKARGMTPVSRILRLETTPAGPRLAVRLGILENEPLVHLLRLRLANDEPAALTSAWLKAELCGAVMHSDLVHRSLYAILEEDCHLSLGHAEQRVEARRASREAAQWLCVRAGSPLLYVERLTYLSDNRLVGVTETLYRSDHYALTSVVYR
jgi:GntR family transcriptional regulator